MYGTAVTAGVAAALLGEASVVAVVVAVVWSTPGPALLAATGPVEGGLAAVVGALRDGRTRLLAVVTLLLLVLPREGAS